MEQDLNVFLNNAKAALADYSQTSGQVSELRKQQETCEANLNALKKQRDDQIAQTYKKRRAEIDKTYDGEIDKCNERLRKAQNKREKAKDQGVKERIAEETADLRAQKKDLQSQIRAELKQGSVSGLYNNSLFYALYLPRSLGDVFTIVLTFAIVFFVIPFGVYRLFFNENTTALILIYILDVIVFGGLYVLISRGALMKHHDVLEDVRLKRDEIDNIDKRIKNITRNILNDKSEDQYDLAVFDDEIAHIKQDLADVTMKKNEALNTFENVTKNIITDEITSAAKSKIDEAQRALDNASQSFNETESLRKEKALALSNNYEVYLGRDFMNRAKIEKLQELANHGTATSISELIEEYNRANDI